MSSNKSFNRIRELQDLNTIIGTLPRNHEIDFSSGWLERAIDHGDLPPEYADPTSTQELDVRLISKRTVDTMQRALTNLQALPDSPAEQ